MKKIAVQPEVLIKVGGQIGTIAVDFETQYKKIYSLVDNVNQQWSGADQKEFYDKIVGFRNDFEEMKKIMDDYARVLNAAGKAYQNAQTSVINDARKLRTDL